MQSRFLEICGPLQLETNDSASGLLRLGLYQGRLHLVPATLLLEGVHQCAVRLGRSVIPGGNTKGARVLPVAIKSFVQHENVTVEDCAFHCRAIPFGDSARISVRVHRQGRPLANAEIHVALL